MGSPWCIHINISKSQNDLTNVLNRKLKLLILFVKINASFHRKVQQVLKLQMPVHFLRLISCPDFIKCLPLSIILQESGQCLSSKNKQYPSLPQFSFSTLLVRGHSTYYIKLQTFVYSVSCSGLSSSRTGNLTIIMCTRSKSQPSVHGSHWINASGRIAPP